MLFVMGVDLLLELIYCCVWDGFRVVIVAFVVG